MNVFEKIDLSTIVTVEEWRQLPAAEQPTAAHRAESFWRARARLLTGMLRVAERISCVYGEVWYNNQRNLDQLSTHQMHKRLREVDPDLPDHMLPITPGELAAAVTSASETVAYLLQHLEDCWVEVDRWRDLQEGTLYLEG